MTLADDLRATAVDHAAVAITQALAGGTGGDSERLARAAVEVAAAFLVDAERVEQALAARKRIACANSRTVRFASGRLAVLRCKYSAAFFGVTV